MARRARAPASAAISPRAPPLLQTPYTGACALVRRHIVRSASAGSPSTPHGSVTVLSRAPQVKKQGRKRKEAIVDTILECLDAYTHVYVYSMDNMRTSIIKGM